MGLRKADVSESARGAGRAAASGRPVSRSARTASCGSCRRARLRYETKLDDETAFDVSGGRKKWRKRLAERLTFRAWTSPGPAGSRPARSSSTISIGRLGLPKAACRTRAIQSFAQAYADRVREHRSSARATVRRADPWRAQSADARILPGDWGQLSGSQRKSYDRAFEAIRSRWPDDTPLRGVLDSARMRPVIIDWFESYAVTPATANMHKAGLSKLLSFALDPRAPRPGRNLGPWRQAGSPQRAAQRSSWTSEHIPRLRPRSMPVELRAALQLA